jgi:thiol:disulfide interchange protein
MRTIVLMVATLAVALPSQGQFEPIGAADEYMRWEASVAPDSVRPGNGFKAVLDAYIVAPWKLYALDESLPPRENGPRPFGVTTEWTLPAGMSLDGAPVQSTPEDGFDPNFELDLLWFHNRARFVYSVATQPDIASGAHEVAGGAKFQICNDDRGVCLPPTVMTFAATVTVDPNCLMAEGNVTVECSGDAATLDALFADVEPQAVSSSPRPPRRGSEAANAGLLGFLLLAVGAGLASLLTPCVFPMIPLTVSYFTKHADNPGRAARMASVFGGTIVATFTGLGIAMAILVGAAGAQSIAANPWVNLFIAGVLVVFALSLLGLFELRLPNSLVNYTNRQSNEQGGYAGVLFMGLTLTLVSFSCTAPFVGGLLAAAAGGSWLYPMGGMLAYSTAFAMPFVLLAIFPNALASLPTAGGWMNNLKVVLGFVELAAAIKFISNADLVWGWEIISRPLAISVTIVIFAVAGIYLLGKIRLPHDSPVESIGVGRLIASIGFIAISLYMIPGLLGAPLNKLDAYLPPRQGTDISLLSQSSIDRAGQNDEAWFVDDIPGAISAGLEASRPVLVDFTGYTCTNCREMEANVFPRKAVQDRFDERFVLLRLYTDGLEKGSEFQRYQLGMTGTVALPTYAVVDPVTEELVLAVSGLMEEDEFVDFLDGGYYDWSQEAVARSTRGESSNADVGG